MYLLKYPGITTNNSGISERLKLTGIECPAEICKIDLHHPPLKIVYQLDSNEAESQFNHFYYYELKKTDFEENFNNI